MHMLLSEFGSRWRDVRVRNTTAYRLVSLRILRIGSKYTRFTQGFIKIHEVVDCSQLLNLMLV